MTRQTLTSKCREHSVKREFDKDGYLMAFCPHCGENISCKYNKTREVKHPVLFEITDYQCEVFYKCNNTDKFFIEFG